MSDHYYRELCPATLGLTCHQCSIQIPEDCARLTLSCASYRSNVHKLLQQISA